MKIWYLFYRSPTEDQDKMEKAKHTGLLNMSGKRQKYSFFKFFCPFIQNICVPQLDYGRTYKNTPFEAKICLWAPSGVSAQPLLCDLEGKLRGLMWVTIPSILLFVFEK